LSSTDNPLQFGDIAGSTVNWDKIEGYFQDIMEKDRDGTMGRLRRGFDSESTLEGRMLLLQAESDKRCLAKPTDSVSRVQFREEVRMLKDLEESFPHISVSDMTTMHDMITESLRLRTTAREQAIRLNSVELIRAFSGITREQIDAISHRETAARLADTHPEMAIRLLSGKKRTFNGLTKVSPLCSEQGRSLVDLLMLPSVHTVDGYTLLLAQLCAVADPFISDDPIVLGYIHKRLLLLCDRPHACLIGYHLHLRGRVHFEHGRLVYASGLPHDLCLEVLAWASSEASTIDLLPVDVASSEVSF
jgi:hypothetical protein